MKDYELEDYIADLKIELDDAEMETPRNEYIRTHRHNEDKPVSNSPTCWGTLQDEEFTPAFTSVPKVPAGIYEVVWNRQLNQNTLKKQPHPHLRQETKKLKRPSRNLINHKRPNLD